MTKAFLKWWLAVVLQLAVMGVSVFYGYHNFVLENDSTFLSGLILLVWLVTTIFIGKYAYQRKENFEVQWFSAETCMTIGMIGTVVGFLMMLGDSFGHLDPKNTEQMRQVIAEMAIGLSVALLTTLNGLIASLFLKIQMIVVENSET
jgi:hypothetical protein